MNIEEYGFERSDLVVVTAVNAYLKNLTPEARRETLSEIGKAYSGADLAYNSKGQTLPSAIIDITNTTIIRVMFPTFSQLQDDKENMQQVASKSIRLSSFVLAPALIGLAAMSYRLVPLLYTEKWNSCSRRYEQLPVCDLCEEATYPPHAGCRTGGD